MGMDDSNPELDRLDLSLDQLEEVLEPLLQGDLGAVSSHLPLLDKAKLMALTTYSIESMLFSALRLNEVDAKNHAVFKELTRVRQYFEKIKKIENPVGPRENMSVNKEAAIRILSSDLGDNKKLKQKLAEQLAKEKAKAALKASKDKKRSADDSPAAADSDGQAKRPKHSGKKSSKQKA